MNQLIADTIKNIKPLDKAAMAAARLRQDRLTKPQGALGRLEELSVQLAGIQAKALPEIKQKAIITMAADHGVVRQGVSLYPPEVTAQMVANFLKGGAGINVIARQVGARVVVVDMGVAGQLASDPRLINCKVAPGTTDMCQGAAMSNEQAERAIVSGVKIIGEEIARGLDMVGTGDMGIGNTTASSAICAVITGRPVCEVTGRGTGVEDKQLQRKITTVTRAIEVNKPDAKQPLEVLAKVGGFEIGGLVGVMLGAAAKRVPVVIDGFISGAAALIACVLAPGLKDYLVAAHVSVEPGHKHMLHYMGLKPLLDLDLRLGEGTGAALGIFLCETAARVLAEMATFSEAGVAEKNEGAG